MRNKRSRLVLKIPASSGCKNGGFIMIRITRDQENNIMWECKHSIPDVEYIAPRNPNNLFVKHNDKFVGINYHEIYSIVTD